MVSTASLGAKKSSGAGPGSGSPVPIRASTWVMPTVLECRSSGRWVWTARSTAALPAKSTATVGTLATLPTAS